MIAYFMGVLMSAAVKWVGDDIPLLQILFFRFAIGLCFLLPPLMRYETAPFQTISYKMHIIRGLLGLFTIWSFYSAIQILPFVTYVTLSNIYPFIMVMICFFVLREKISIAQWTAIGFGFCGILFIARPHFDVSLWGIALVFMGTLTGAITDIMAKKMTEYDSSVKITSFYFLLSAAILLCFMPYIWVMPKSLLIWGALILVGISGVALQYFLCEAYKHLNASKVAIWRYSEFLWALLFGLTIWDEVPTIALWAGALLIFASNFIIQYLSPEDKEKGHEK